jgi:hypothetical protein
MFCINFIEAAIAAQKQQQFLDLLAGGVLLDRHVEMCTESAGSDRRTLICDIDGHRKESLPLLWNHRRRRGACGASELDPPLAVHP